MSKLIEIEALDTLFFRDGKPFSLGEESWADVIFPPYPSTIYGMLRSVYFEENMGELAKANAYVGHENIDPTKDLTLSYIGLHLDRVEENQPMSEMILPLPQDFAILDKKNGEASIALLSFEEQKDIVSSNPLSHKLIYNGKEDFKGSTHNLYVTLAELQAYLDNQPLTKAIDLSKHVIQESKIGIGRSYESGRTKDGELYRIGMSRLASEWQDGATSKVTLIAGFDGLEIKLPHTNRFGGEGKVVSLDALNKSLPSIDKPKISGGFVKMYLATPAIFEDGWQPQKLLENYDLEVATAAIGKPLNIGGWDVKSNKPKPMQKAVPAGSVFYLKGDAEQLEKFVNEYHGKCLNGDGVYPQYPPQGFGLVYFGTAKITS